jgi:hypothetical protein
MALVVSKFIDCYLKFIYSYLTIVELHFDP